MHSAHRGDDHRLQHHGPLFASGLHVTCFACSFSSRGVDCSFCNQSLAEFAKSASVLASYVFHGCVVDVDVPPSSRGNNSLLDSAIPRLPQDLTRSGHLADFEESSDRRTEWFPNQTNARQWDSQWLCLRCDSGFSRDQPSSLSWFSHRPLINVGRLYGWCNSPINPPGAGPHVMAFLPVALIGVVPRRTCTVSYAAFNWFSRDC